MLGQQGLPDNLCDRMGKDVGLGKTVEDEDVVEVDLVITNIDLYKIHCVRVCK